MGKGEIERTSASHVTEAGEDDGSPAGAAARFDDAGNEPSYSQVLPHGARPSVRPSLRPSIRPSAFGPPRASLRPPAALPDLPPLREFSVPGSRSSSKPGEELARHDECEPDPFPTSEPSSSKRPSDPAIVGAAGEAPSSLLSQAEPPASIAEEPTPSGPRRRLRTPEQGTSLAASIASSQSPETFRADLEDLLPFVSAKSSVPPTLPALPEKPARPQDPKRNRISLSIFGVMLLASIVPIARYASNDDAPSPPPPRAAAKQTKEAAVAKQPAVAPELAAPSPALPEKPPADPMLEALAQAETGLPEDPVAAADQLMNLGLKALANGDERFAEALLGRALKRDDDNPRAYFALARIRMSQGNLQGAEGWIVSALHKRPRRAEYHAFYATVLDGLGRTEEATKARAKANQLRDDRLE